MSTIGFIYPGLGATEDFALAPQLIPDLDVGFYNTDDGDVMHTVDDLRAVGEPALLASRARSLVQRYPNAASIIWTCTSGSFVYGWNGAHVQASAIEQEVGVPASSTSIAFASAVHHLGLSNIAIAATYPQAVARYFSDFMIAAEVNVVNMICRNIPSAAGAGALTLQQIVALARDADTAQAQAVLIPDTAMHSIQWISKLEDALHKPVLTANQVSIWEGMRLADVSTVGISGVGSLFQ